MKIKYTIRPKTAETRTRNLYGRFIWPIKILVIEFLNYEDFIDFCRVSSQITPNDRYRERLEKYGNLCINLACQKNGRQFYYNGVGTRAIYEKNKDYTIIKYTDL